MQRRKVNPRRDKRVFTKTADKTKSLNTSALGFRGGIRL